MTRNAIRFLAALFVAATLAVLLIGPGAGCATARVVSSEAVTEVCVEYPRRIADEHERGELEDADALDLLNAGETVCNRMQQLVREVGRD